MFNSNSVNLVTCNGKLNVNYPACLERFLKGNSDAVANLLGENSDKYVKVYAPISEQLYGSDKEWDPIENLRD